MNSTKEEQAEKNLQFSQQASQRQTGFLMEFWLFLLGNKKWWLTPVVVLLLFLGVLVILGSTAAAPFIYTLF